MVGNSIRYSRVTLFDNPQQIVVEWNNRSTHEVDLFPLMWKNNIEHIAAIKKFVGDYIAELGTSPAVSKIAAGTGMSNRNYRFRAIECNYVI